MRRFVGEAVALVERWIDQHLSRPNADEHSRRQFAEFKQKAAQVALELTDYLGESPPRGRRAGALLLHRVLTDIVQDFHGGFIYTRIDPTEACWLETLKIPSIELQQDLTDGPRGMALLLQHIAAPATLGTAIISHLDSGYLGNARQLMRLAENPEEFNRLLPEKQKAARRRVDGLLDTTATNLETSLLNGAVTETQRNEFSRRIERLKKGLEENPDEPDAILSAARAMEQKIQQHITVQRGQILQRLELLKTTLRSKNLQGPVDTYLESAIAAGNFSVAEEVILRATKALEAGETDLTPVVPSAQNIDWYADLIGRLPDLMVLADDLRRSSRLILSATTPEMPELREFEQAARTAIVEILETWGKIAAHKRDRNLPSTPAPLFAILDWLGFHIGKGAKLVSKGEPPIAPNFWQHYQLEAQIESPLPRFGSLANGHHTIVLVWDKLEEEQIAHWVKNMWPRNRPSPSCTSTPSRPTLGAVPCWLRAKAATAR